MTFLCYSAETSLMLAKKNFLEYPVFGGDRHGLTFTFTDLPAPSPRPGPERERLVVRAGLSAGPRGGASCAPWGKG